MKAIFFVAVVSAIILVAKTINIFAATKNCIVTICNSAEKKNTENKTATANTFEFDNNPFIILIPGNHF